MGCAIERRKAGNIIFCGKGIQPCHFCGQVADYLCDHPIGDGKTCDLPMCGDCAQIVGDNLDVCPMHYRENQPNVTRIREYVTREQRRQTLIPRRVRRK